MTLLATGTDAATLPRGDDPADDPRAAGACRPGEACAEIGEIAWLPGLEEAMRRGQLERKPVLIVFSARQQEPGQGDDF